MALILKLILNSTPSIKLLLSSIKLTVNIFYIHMFYVIKYTIFLSTLKNILAILLNSELFLIRRISIILYIFYFIIFSKYGNNNRTS